jgi:hypothetical protein
MTSSLRFDHLLIAVHDLESAVRDYSRLGFNVTPGGRHTHAPTRNALIYFDDGSYLELIEWLAPAKGEKWYERLNAVGEGIVDFALCPQDVEAVIERTGGEGVAYRKAVPGSRVQSDGEEIRWLLGWAIESILPFLCSDVTDRSLRVPEGACRQHSNGVKGILELSVAVPDLDSAIATYERLLQMKASRYNADSATFRVGGSDLLLESNREKAGPVVYCVVLNGIAREDTLTLDIALTHGAAISHRSSVPR